MRYLFASLIIGLFVLGISSVNAQEMYIGGAGGYAMDAFDQDVLYTGLGADPDEINGSWAAYAFFGYGINDKLFIQADFGYYFAFAPDETAFEDDELSLWTLMGSVKYNFMAGQKWTPFVIGGVGWGSLSSDNFQIPDQDGVLDDKQSGLVARVGGGVDYNISDTLKLTADAGYVFTFGDIENWNFIDVRVGLAFTFK